MKYIYRLIKLLQQWRLESFLIIFFLAFLTYFFSFNEYEFLKSLYDSAALFALDIRINPDKVNNGWIYFLALLASTYTLLSVVELLLKEKVQEIKKAEVLRRGGHIIVIGLSESSRFYLDSMQNDDNNSILIVENNKSNVYLEHYHENVAIKIMDLTDKKALQSLQLEQCEHIVVSTGSDMTNLEVAIHILSFNENVKIFLQLEDRSLRYFHKEHGILSGGNIRIYSYYEDAARELFEQYDIDGIGNEIIQSNQSFSIAVVGNTILAHEVVAHACIMGQLPNENLLTIYCIDKDVQAFKESIELSFPEISNVPNVTLKYFELNLESKSFYQDNIWEDKLTNIILCLEDDQRNLDIASNLINLTFIEKIITGKMYTQIIMSMSNGYSLGEHITGNQDLFKYLYTFGAAVSINHEKYIVSGERDKQAIATHFVYSHIGAKSVDYETYTYEYYAYDKNNEYSKTGFIEIEDKDWYPLSYFKKESNRSVADHIKMKLKYMGLRPFKSNEKDVRILFSFNKIIFNQKMKNKILLAKTEHNRWNAFHYLNGYMPISFISKEEKKRKKEIHETLKQHMCLVHFEEFKKKSNELLELGYGQGEFEGYDFMINDHIPLILANAGYAIEKIESLNES